MGLNPLTRFRIHASAQWFGLLVVPAALVLWAIVAMVQCSAEAVKEARKQNWVYRIEDCVFYNKHLGQVKKRTALGQQLVYEISWPIPKTPGINKTFEPKAEIETFAKPIPCQ